MKECLSPLTPDRITIALYALAQNVETIPAMLSDDNAREILKPQAWSYLQGVLQKFAAETEEDGPLDLTQERLQVLAVALVHVGIALGRYYERTESTPRIAKTLSIEQAYAMCEGEES